MAESKLRLILGGKNTQPQSLTQNQINREKNLQLSEVLSKFDTDLSLKVKTLEEYDSVSNILHSNQISFTTKIIRYKVPKGRPTEYYINIVENLE